MKVRWALCEKDDLEEFRNQLFGYTLAIESLLNVVQTFESLISGSWEVYADGLQGEQGSAEAETN